MILKRRKIKEQVFKDFDGSDIKNNIDGKGELFKVFMKN